MGPIDPLHDPSFVATILTQDFVARLFEEGQEITSENDKLLYQRRFYLQGAVFLLGRCRQCKSRGWVSPRHERPRECDYCEGSGMITVRIAAVPAIDASRAFV